MAASATCSCHLFSARSIWKCCGIEEQQHFYSQILNLNTVALQISNEMLFEAGKSNHIENNKKLVNITIQKLICRVLDVILKLKMNDVDGRHGKSFLSSSVHPLIVLRSLSTLATASFLPSFVCPSIFLGNSSILATAAFIPSVAHPFFVWTLRILTVLHFVMLLENCELYGM